MKSSTPPKRCVTFPWQNAHLFQVNFTFALAVSLDFVAYRDFLSF